MAIAEREPIALSRDRALGQGRGGRAKRLGGLSPPPTFRSGELISKIAPPLVCPKNILQGTFWSHKRNYSIRI